MKSKEFVVMFAGLELVCVVLRLSNFKIHVSGARTKEQRCRNTYSDVVSGIVPQGQFAVGILRLELAPLTPLDW